MPSRRMGQRPSTASHLQATDGAKNGCPDLQRDGSKKGSQAPQRADGDSCGPKPRTLRYGMPPCLCSCIAEKPPYQRPRRPMMVVTSTGTMPAIILPTEHPKIGLSAAIYKGQLQTNVHRCRRLVGNIRDEMLTPDGDTSLSAPSSTYQIAPDARTPQRMRLTSAKHPRPKHTNKQAPREPGSGRGHCWIVWATLKYRRL